MNITSITFKPTRCVRNNKNTSDQDSKTQYQKINVADSFELKLKHSSNVSFSGNSDEPCTNEKLGRFLNDYPMYMPLVEKLGTDLASSIINICSLSIFRKKRSIEGDYYGSFEGDFSMVASKFEKLLEKENGSPKDYAKGIECAVLVEKLSDFKNINEVDFKNILKELQNISEKIQNLSVTIESNESAEKAYKKACEIILKCHDFCSYYKQNPL